MLSIGVYMKFSFKYFAPAFLLTLFFSMNTSANFLHDLVATNNLWGIKTMFNLSPEMFKEDLKKQNSQGLTPLLLAKRLGRIEIARFLNDHGAENILMPTRRFSMNFGADEDVFGDIDRGPFTTPEIEDNDGYGGF